MKLSVESEFQKYLARVLPKGTVLARVQYVEMRRAFFAGFGQALLGVRDEATKLNEQAGAAMLEGLLDEVNSFWKAQIQ